MWCSADHCSAHIRCVATNLLVGELSVAPQIQIWRSPDIQLCSEMYVRHIEDGGIVEVSRGHGRGFHQGKRAIRPSEWVRVSSGYREHISHGWAPTRVESCM